MCYIFPNASPTYLLCKIILVLSQDKYNTILFKLKYMFTWAKDDIIVKVLHSVAGLGTQILISQKLG